MSFDDRFADCKTQTGATIGGVIATGLLEALEYRVFLFSRNAHAGVFDFEHDVGAVEIS